MDDDGRARPAPSRRLAPQAAGLWALGALAWALPLLVAAPLAARGLDAPGWSQALVALVVLVAGALGVLVVPRLRVRHWRWEVRDEEIDLRHGAFTVVRTIVPMARVQHVDVRRSPLAHRAGTADLVVHTAAGRTTIPMLPEADAVEVRDRIADLARTPDDS